MWIRRFGKSRTPRVTATEAVPKRLVHDRHLLPIKQQFAELGTALLRQQSFPVYLQASVHQALEHPSAAARPSPGFCTAAAVGAHMQLRTPGLSLHLELADGESAARRQPVELFLGVNTHGERPAPLQSVAPPAQEMWTRLATLGGQKRALWPATKLAQTPRAVFGNLGTCSTCIRACGLRLTSWQLPAACRRGRLCACI